MAIGLSTYAFFWRISERVEHPLTLREMLEAHPRQRLLGVADLRLHAAGDALARGTVCSRSRPPKSWGSELELGTRGISPEHLRRYLDFADQLDVTLVRSMVNTADHRPTEAEAIDLLAQTAPEYAERGVTLALETYEQVPSAQLVRIVEAVGSETLGICLDPANCVAGLELPTDVVAAYRSVREELARQRLRLHPAGRLGRIHPDRMPPRRGTAGLRQRRAHRPTAANDINQIVEHWLPWQDDAATTCALETQWTQHNINYLRSKS